MIDPEAQGEAYQKNVTYVIYAVIAVLAFLSYSFILTAITSLVAWMVFAGLVYGAYSFAPAIALWFANKKVQALVAVIEANPIETMKNLFMEKSQELASAANDIRDFEEELGNFRDQVKSVKEEYPEDVDEYVDTQKRMEGLLAEMKSEQTGATGELSEFGKKIRKAETLFKLAKSANKMLEKSQSAQQAVYAQIKESVSFNKVRSDLNRAFANLNAAVDRRKNASIVTSKPRELPPAVEVEDVTPLKRVVGIKR